MDYCEQAQRYEVMSEVAKLLQPFYEDARGSKVHTHIPSVILRFLNFGGFSEQSTSRF